MATKILTDPPKQRSYSLPNPPSTKLQNHEYSPITSSTTGLDDQLTKLANAFKSADLETLSTLLAEETIIKSPKFHEMTLPLCFSITLTKSIAKGGNYLKIAEILIKTKIQQIDENYSWTGFLTATNQEHHEIVNTLSEYIQQDKVDAAFSLAIEEDDLVLQLIITKSSKFKDVPEYLAIMSFQKALKNKDMGHQKENQAILIASIKSNRIPQVHLESAVIKSAKKGNDEVLQALEPAFTKGTGFGFLSQALLAAAENGHKKCVDIFIKHPTFKLLNPHFVSQAFNKATEKNHQEVALALKNG